jgi:hypothetical protein
MYYDGPRQFDLPIGPVTGKAGETHTIRVKPQCRYRVEKVMLVDDGDPPGSVTEVTEFLVGQQIQRPATGGGTRTTFFGPDSLANGVTWGVCEPALSIVVTVRFLSDATFRGSLFGSAV